MEQDVYRKRTRSNVIVPPEDRRPGQTVWVGNGTRELRICGEGGKILTLDEHRRAQEIRKEENRIANKHKARRSPKFDRPYSLW